MVRRAIVVGVGVVSGEGEDWVGLLALRSFVGVPTCTPNSLTRAEGEGFRFLSPDRSRVLSDRFLPLSPETSWVVSAVGCRGG